MLIKLVLVFLGAIAIMGMLGNLLFPGGLRRIVKKRLGAAKPASCARCGRYVIGKSCDCRKG